MSPPLTPLPLSPLRVLHISGRSDHGGGPEHIRQIIGADIPGVHHHVACPNAGIYWERYREMLGEGRLIPIPHRRLSLAALLGLRAYVRDRGIQVVHSHGMSGGVYGRSLGLLAGLPVLHSFHGVPITPGVKHRFYQLAEHAFALATHCGIAVSAGEADLVHGRWRRYRGRLAVVPNGIGLADAPSSWPAWPPAGVLRIVSFSRHNRQKHPELLIEIARCLALHGVEFRMEAFGEGLDHPSLAAGAARSGVSDRLLFHPSTDAPEQVLSGAHIYLSTSRWEGMPLAILEAWRAGLVVVASDVVGNRDLVRDGFTGRLFQAGCGLSAAQMIVELLRDPTRAEEIRRRAARSADRNHANDLMALRLSWLYQHAAVSRAQAYPTDPDGLIRPHPMADEASGCVPSLEGLRTARIPPSSS